MNKCIFLGRMTDDPEISYTQGESAMAIARFDFAVDRRSAREGEPTADFFRCTAFDRRAEFMERFGRKGLKLLLTGKMQNNNYTNKEGVKIYSMQLLVDDVEFAESKKNSDETGGVQETQPNRTSARQTPARQAARQTSRQPARAASRPAAGGAQRSAPANRSKDEFMNIDAGIGDGELPFN
ncbi:MAG: single-stranded DNA-binding protein [Hungatella sp.]|nr:single-stranded DNA-binding protein [Hungatella sp.]